MARYYLVTPIEINKTNSETQTDQDGIMSLINDIDIKKYIVLEALNSFIKNNKNMFVYNIVYRPRFSLLLNRNLYSIELEFLRRESDTKLYVLFLYNCDGIINRCNHCLHTIKNMDPLVLASECIDTILSDKEKFLTYYGYTQFMTKVFKAVEKYDPESRSKKWYEYKNWFKFLSTLVHKDILIPKENGLNYHAFEINKLDVDELMYLIDIHYKDRLY